MKQQAMDLGVATPPEIDYDKPKLAQPDDLPAVFPDTNDELLKLAEVFCTAFGGCKSRSAIQKHRAGFTDTLAIMRQRSVSPAAGWQAFVEKVVSQEGRPLFGNQAKMALGYLRNGRSPGTRTDSCGCPLPAGVFMPRLQPGETAHYDAEAARWFIDDPADPKPIWESKQATC